MSQTDWLLSVPVADREQVYGLRHLSHLKVGTAGTNVWVSGLTAEQLTDPAVHRILQKQVYSVAGGKLYPKGSRLPAGPVPAVLWTPIARALPVSLPAYRGNYSDALQPATPELVTATTEQPAVALLTDLKTLSRYVSTAPEVRLKPVSWVVIGTGEALLMGTPLLPIPGISCWARGHILLPAGYDLHVPVLADWLNQTLHPSGNDWTLWLPDSGRTPIPASNWQPLSRQSVRETLTNLSHAG